MERFRGTGRVGLEEERGSLTAGVTNCLALSGRQAGAGSKSSAIGCAVLGGGGN